MENEASTHLGFDDYQELAGRTQKKFDPEYLALGLNEEAGEVAGQVKRIERDDDGVLTDERRAKISKELGDTLWYVAREAAACGLKLSDIARENIEKLRDRHLRGVICGEGSDR